MTFLYFPICLLNMIDDKSEIDDLISYSIVNEAKKIPRDAVDKEYMEPDNLPRDFDDSLLHKQILLVVERKQITVSYLEGTVQGYYQINNYLEDFKNEHFTKNKKHLWTKLPLSLVFKARDGSYNFDKLSVLAAVNGILGADRDNQPDFKKITIARIQAAAAGFKSNKIMPDGAETLSYYQVVRITNKLEKMNFIGKYTRKSRFTYYSTVFKDFEQLCRQVELKFRSDKSKKAQIRRKVIDEIERNR